jgi:hypothetical protein
MMAVLGGGALGASALLASLTSAVPVDAEGDAIPMAYAGGGDGGSTFVTQAQKGEVVPPDVEDVEQMCALLTSCKGLPLPPQFIPHDFGDCMRKMSADMSKASSVFYSLTIRECGLTATSCDALRNCVLRGVPKDTCSGRAMGADTVGVCYADDKSGKDFALTCWKGNILSVRDCTRGGETCQVNTPRDCKDNCSAQSGCYLGPCGDVKEGAPPQCSKSGSHLIHCERSSNVSKPLLVSLDCQAFGLRCTTDDSGKAGCATTLKECKGNTKHCDGDVSVGCFNGHEVRVDCKKIGLTCNTSGTGIAVGDCTAPEGKNACDPKDAAKCNGGKISYCFAGKSRSYDCGTFFGKCDAKGGVHCNPR